MEYRDATENDFQAFIELGKRIHALSPYRALTFCERKVFTRFAAYLENKNKYFCKIAETKGDIAGIFYAKLLPTEYSNDLIACDVYFWVNNGFRRMSIASDLIQMFIDWAKKNKAAYIQLQNGAGLVDDLSALFEKAGLQKTGSIYGVAS